jgi:site-specific DNA-adenine methylase
MSYPGGKGVVFHQLINLMPPHEVFIEAHLGGGAVIRNKRLADRNIGIDIDPEVITRWKGLNLENIELVNGDANDYLKSYRITGKEMIYCDPPYIRATRKMTRRLYKYEYTLKQHMELLEIIRSLSCMVMISGYESKLYKDVLKGWNTHTFIAGCQHGIAIEWVWMNYSPPLELHDYRYLGVNFRDREQIRNKLKRWIRRIKAMPVLERKALLSALESLRDGN